MQFYLKDSGYIWASWETAKSFLLQIEGELRLKYDYLVVGAGLYGAAFAHEAKKAGKS